MSEVFSAMKPGVTGDVVTMKDHRSGKKFEFPIMDGAVGPSVVDVRKFYSQTGYFTYDPGYTSTGSCESGITYIDGDEGILLYRGYSIEELAENSTFLEVCQLLLEGELPTADSKKAFSNHITYH